jgi:predicted RNA-binding Zn-ribbon protein involved in translation (DUF1610 family)
MAEITALEKHPCAACGAQAEWHPGKQRLVCPFCGTEAPYKVVDGAGGKVVIEELDLVRALRELPEEARGWRAEKRSVQCRSCKAVVVFDPERVGQNCEFCGSPSLVDYQEIKAPIRPQSLLAFKVAESRVREDIRRWLGSHWLAPGALKRRGLVDTMHGLYVPYWTFDANATCTWHAESGTYYYTTETNRDSQGKTQTRQVRHVNWEPASGVVRHTFDDEPVCGSHGLDKRWIKAIEPFPTKELVPYDTAYLSGFAVEHYQVVLLDAAQHAEDSMAAQLTEMCARAVPGDTYRNLTIDPRYTGQTFKHILVPVWLLRYNYGARVFQVLVNGYTGAIAGDWPASPWKIFFLILGALLVVLLIVFFAQQ